MFSKILSSTAVVVALLLSLQVDAHAAIAPELGVSGTPVRNDVKRPSAASGCGGTDVASTIDKSTPVIAAANGQFTVTVINFNGGKDGSRQVSATLDATGLGKTFSGSLDILQNGDGNPTNSGPQTVVASLPAGTKCTGGAKKNFCLVSFKTTAGFGNCVVVQQGNGQNVAPASPKAATTTAATSTKAAQTVKATPAKANNGNNGNTAKDPKSNNTTSKASKEDNNKTTKAAKATATAAKDGKEMHHHHHHHHHEQQASQSQAVKGGEEKPASDKAKSNKSESKMADHSKKPASDNAKSDKSESKMADHSKKPASDKGVHNVGSTRAPRALLAGGEIWKWA